MKLFDPQILKNGIASNHEYWEWFLEFQANLREKNFVEVQGEVLLEEKKKWIKRIWGIFI